MGKKPGVLPPALVVSLIIIVVSVGVYGAFLGTSLLFGARVSAAETEVNTKKAELKTAQESAADALSFVERIGLVSSLASSHNYWSGLISELAARTDKRVQYLSLRANEKENIVVLEARAADYGAVQRELVSLNDSVNIKQAVAKNIRYNIDPRTQIVTVNFDVRIELEAGVLHSVPPSYELKTVGGAQ